ncbi:MAG: CHAT domain-containing tetratricopeptide repeat protein [Terracidiphilus sp.]
MPRQTEPRRRLLLRYAWLLLLLILIPLKDSVAISAQSEYDQARQLFVHGDLEGCQHEAERGYERFQTYNPKWASEFQLLKAEVLLQRGMYGDVLQALRDYDLNAASRDSYIRSLTIESLALLRQEQLAQGEQKLAQASDLCKSAAYDSCGEVLQARGIFIAWRGDFQQARGLFLSAHQFAEARHDRYLDASAILNLGWTALQVDHFDEALDWLRTATRLSGEIGAEDLKEKCSGNLGWAYYQLGDDQRALQQFLIAKEAAAHVGNLRYQLRWLSVAGYVYRDRSDWPRAMECYRQALLLSRELDSKEDTVNVLEDMAQISAVRGNLEEAGAFIDQVTPMETAGGEHINPNLMLTKGELAAGLHRDTEAEADYRSVWNNPGALTTIRLDAGSELATLYELRRRTAAAEQMYTSTLKLYESARETLKKEETQLPYGANATEIYDDYIHLLIQQGRTDAALETAEQSRGWTLEQGLDANRGKRALARVALEPRRIAQSADATLLFYWLGENQSYLWAITSARIAMFTLPPRQQIADHVQSYSNAILKLQDPLAAGNPDGKWLYQSLVAPANGDIRRDKPVIVLAEGALSELNFETLIVPGPGPRQNLNSGVTGHYLIDDLTMVSAPSLAMLAAPKTVQARGTGMLLLGDPVSPGPDFPTLPLFAYEITRIESDFGKDRVAVVDGWQATPAAYFSSHPSRYSYIHFVSHAIANSTDPLDSAIILSNSARDDNSFKLYARDIIRQPIDAQLVTISACYGSGTRLYAGEGLVGLSWAFLRAGAERVVGALWEVSDISTPRLMDSFYGSIAAGNSPEASLRTAKLTLLHSAGRFTLPFYWAAFQMYDRE